MLHVSIDILPGRFIAIDDRGERLMESDNWGEIGAALADYINRSGFRLEPEPQAGEPTASSASVHPGRPRRDEPPLSVVETATLESIYRRSPFACLVATRHLVSGESPTLHRALDLLDPDSVPGEDLRRAVAGGVDPYVAACQALGVADPVSEPGSVAGPVSGLRLHEPHAEPTPTANDAGETEAKIGSGTPPSADTDERAQPFRLGSPVEGDPDAPHVGPSGLGSCVIIGLEEVEGGGGAIVPGARVTRWEIGLIARYWHDVYQDILDVEAAGQSGSSEIRYLAYAPYRLKALERFLTTADATRIAESRRYREQRR